MNKENRPPYPCGVNLKIDCCENCPSLDLITNFIDSTSQTLHITPSELVKRLRGGGAIVNRIWTLNGLVANIDSSSSCERFEEARVVDITPRH